MKELLDFRNFLYMAWKHLNLPEPTPVQYDIAQFLQDAPKRGVIEAFRGVGKSYITSAFVCWKLLLDSEHKVLVVSASKTRSDDFSTFTQRLIQEMPVLHHLKSGKGKDNPRYPLMLVLPRHPTVPLLNQWESLVNLQDLVQILS